MFKHQCRMCAKPLPQTHLLHFRNMPKAAQHLPDDRSDAGIDLDVYQCVSCGLVQISNEPVSYYKEVIRAAAFSEEMKAFRRKQFGEFVRNHALQGKKLIEIGCGRGEYLALLQEAGVDAYGLEYADQSVRDCICQGLRVSHGFVDSPDYELAQAPFDAFAVLNFLEHWPDPNASLSGIAHNLSDEAIGLVEVPNFDMILKKNLFTEFIIDHILYFTRETLETLLRLNGFEVIEFTEVWHGYIISAVVRKRASCDVSAFDGSRQRLKMEIDNFVCQHGDRGVAIWGAGHQSLAAIALLGLSREIKYVVDSAPFKQNKFTPASHIPIFSPDRLKIDLVGAIIIMAASYSDEVARIIRCEWGDSIQVAILRDYGLESV